ncbi:hypothetical protein CRG98_006370 [Punica granatum]|uniref:Uncharacterized protein n=1 Tax=Punica granatum TaxID=22663 RepID=A0A2I0KXN2_PUNGR|nr:hypothetical protein CRG98_006370 [Punica granatum]
MRALVTAAAPALAVTARARAPIRAPRTFPLCMHARACTSTSQTFVDDQLACPRLPTCPTARLCTPVYMLPRVQLTRTCTPCTQTPFQGFNRVTRLSNPSSTLSSYPEARYNILDLEKLGIDDSFGPIQFRGWFRSFDQIILDPYRTVLVAESRIVFNINALGDNL